MTIILDWPKKRITLITRWLLIITVSYLIIFSRGYRLYYFLSPETLLILLFILSNLYLHLRPNKLFEKKGFNIVFTSHVNTPEFSNKFKLCFKGRLIQQAYTVVAATTESLQLFLKFFDIF